jgi:hypothetical protein
MKKVLIILCFAYSSISAQEIKWGIGLSLNYHLFYHSNNNVYVNSVFRPAASRTYGIGLKREIASKGLFKTQVGLNILKKNVALSSKDDNYKQTLNYQFFATDVSVNILYDNPETRYKLRPYVGLSLISSYYIGARYREKWKSFSGSKGFGVGAISPEESYKWYLYPCLNLGVSKLFHLRKEGHTWEGTLSTQLSPAQSFRNLNVPSPINNVQLLAGNLHQISLAVNRFF